MKYVMVPTKLGVMEPFKNAVEP